MNNPQPIRDWYDDMFRQIALMKKIKQQVQQKVNRP